MKTQHTPGPWIYEPLQDGYGFAVKPIPGQIVADCLEESNARLIAAAPELLEALQSCVGSLLYAVDALEAPQDSMMRSNLAFAMQTIKKAKGE